MTASLPDIGTLSIFPSVPKREKKKSKRKKDTEELFRYFSNLLIMTIYLI